MNITFSIIIPVYNVKEYLSQCVESVICQTYSSFEIILVDDGSTDGCSELCDYFGQKDNRIRVIHKKNGGLVSARIAGAMMARGDYVICVDGDDWVDRKYLDEANNIIKRNEPDIIVFGWCEANGTHISEKSVGENKVFDRNEIKQSIFPKLIYKKNGEQFPTNIWAKVYRRPLYIESQLKVDTRINMGEDTACVAPCIVKCQRLYVSKLNLYYYRYNQESITKKKKPLPYYGPELIHKHLQKELKGEGSFFLDQINRRTVHAFFNVSVSRFFGKKTYKEVHKEICLALKEDYIKIAIKESSFSETRMKLVKAVLRIKAVFLIFLYSKTK